MKPNKGFITVLMMVLISISLSTFSRAAFDTFSDVPNDSPFHESIFYLAERGIVCGEGNGRYVPDAPVTVRQWATMLCRALGDADPLNYDDDCIRQGYKDTGYAVIYKVTESVLTELFGRPPSLYSRFMASIETTHCLYRKRKRRCPL